VFDQGLLTRSRPNILVVGAVKILAIQFRYLGDAVLMTPALRALAQQFPSIELHVAVAAEVAPVLEHLPWLKRVWALPRVRGNATALKTWPVIRALRQERFDRSVDFSGNDRSAIISLLCGARDRLGPSRKRGFLGHKFCYTQTIELSKGGHQTGPNLQLLRDWGITPPEPPQIEIRADPARAGLAEQLLPRPAILCHVATSQSKKDWPITHWAELYRLATGLGLPLMFSSGVAPREQKLLEELKTLVPDAPALPTLPDLATFLAVLARARLVVCGCTGPLHFAAALGVPTIGLFGPSSASLWAPLGEPHRALQAPDCSCGSDTSVCVSAAHCIAKISPEAVVRFVLQALDANEMSRSSPIDY